MLLLHSVVELVLQKNKLGLIPDPNFYNGFVTWSNLERLLHSLNYSAVDASERRASSLRASLTVSVFISLL